MKKGRTRDKAVRVLLRWPLLIVIVAFAVMGSVLIFRSFAANPNLPGDVNNDNVVNITDLSILLSNWGKTYNPNPGPNPNPPNPNPGDGQTAAAKFNWGQPMSGSDEFNYGSPSAPVAVDSSKWSGTSGCGPGHDNNGRRCGKNSVVDGSKLIMSGDANGDTGWLMNKMATKYGRYELRSRSYNTGTSGNEYHPLHLLWPQSNEWPRGAEYDFLENGKVGEQCIEAFLHYPNHQPKRQEFAEKCPVDLTQWHNVGFEWTASGLKGYLDGEEWFSFSKDCIQCAPGPMQLAIQLDNFYGSGMRAAKFEVDWFRQYPAP